MQTSNTKTLYFCNPSIIQNMKDVKIGMVETASNEMSFLELMEGIKLKLVDLITVDVDKIVNTGKYSREEAVEQLSTRILEMLEFFEKTEPTTEDELADLILASKPFDLWQMRAWGNFKDYHKGQMEKDTPIPSQGVLKMDESAVKDALDELTLEGFLEVLKNYN